MMIFRKLLLSSVCLLAGSACFAQEHEYLSKSQDIVTQFSQALKSQLQTAMKEGGPSHAISVCKESAPAIAAELSRQNGAKVQRVSLKYRNPLNMPAQWQRKVLSEFETAQEEQQSNYLETTAHARYMAAIPTQGICLSCHGTNISKEVEALLRSEYPFDLAQGYSEGQLRGAFSVEWDLNQQSN